VYGSAQGGRIFSAPRDEAFEVSQKRDLSLSELLAHLLAHLLAQLKAAKQPDGSCLLDHTTVVYGSNIRTGHSLDNCPTLIAGRGAGVKLGHTLVLSKDTPLCNAWLTLLHGCGLPVESHGDSTCILPALLA
jgi:hypothetical protein